MEKVSAYATKNNLSRLSTATSASKGSIYSGRIKSARLTSVNADAFVRNATLFSRLGGAAEVDFIVRAFYGKALVDERIRKFFDFDDAKEMEIQIRNQIAFVSALLGGPLHEGMDATAARHYLKSLGLPVVCFDALIQHLTSIARGHTMPPPLVEELLQFSTTLKSEMLG
jgi:truncated hemoglobin YjbI